MEHRDAESLELLLLHSGALSQNGHSTHEAVQTDCLTLFLGLKVTALDDSTAWAHSLTISLAIRYNAMLPRICIAADLSHCRGLNLGRKTPESEDISA